MLTPFHFQFVKTVAPTLGGMLIHPKSLSWRHKSGIPLKCNRKRCMCCNVLLERDTVLGGQNKQFKVLDSDCTSDLVVYAATCKECYKLYVGKTVNMISLRKSKHKSDFGQILKKGTSIIDSDGNADPYALGLHLHKDHGLTDINSFDEYYNFCVLEHCTPRMLDVKEHMWIQKCKTLTPLGLNLSSPFSIPLLPLP